MAKSVLTDVISEPLVQEALTGFLAQQNALLGGELAAMGAVVVKKGLMAKAPAIVDVPYFGTIGKGAKLNDGDAITPVALKQGKETATVSRFGHGVSFTQLAEMAAQGDLNSEAARQLLNGVASVVDDELVAVAQAGNVLTHTASSVLTYAEIVKAQSKFDNGVFAGMVVHPLVMYGLRTATDGFNRPLFADLNTGAMNTIAGMKIAVSNKLASQSAMGSVTATGGGPAVTLSGTPNSYIDLKIKIVTNGSEATAKFQFSTDGGSTYSATLTASGSGVLLSDTAVGSQVGVDGLTGITATFATGSYTTSHSYTAVSTTTFKSLLLKPNALALWLNDQALISSGIKVFIDPSIDSQALYLNAYAVCHRYRSMPDSRFPGVCVINSTG